MIENIIKLTMGKETSIAILKDTSYGLYVNIFDAYHSVITEKLQQTLVVMSNYVG